MKNLRLYWGILFLSALALGQAQSPQHSLLVSSWSCRVNQGSAQARGIVENVSDKAIKALRADLRILGGTGEVVSTNSNGIYIEVLDPGEASAFAVSVPVRADQGARCQLGFRSWGTIRIQAAVPDPQ